MPGGCPATRHAYHTNTYGHLVGEVVRRLTGDLPGDALRPLAEPLDADLWFGLPRREHHRCAEVIWAARRRPLRVLAVCPTTSSADALHERCSAHSTRRVTRRSASSTRARVAGGRRCRRPTATATARGWPASTPPCSSRGGCSSPDLLAEAIAAAVDGAVPDPRRRGGLRPRLPADDAAPALRPATPRSFGHFGTGGSLGFADPDAGVAFGYVMNHVIPRWQSTRNQAWSTPSTSRSDRAP